MDDVCNMLNGLSKILQKSDLYVVELLPKIIITVQKLNSCFVSRDFTTTPFTASLKVFYQSLPADEVISQDLINMHNNCVGFAKRVIENIALRFPEDSQQIIDAMSYLYPRKLQMSKIETQSQIAMDLLEKHYESLFETSELHLEYSLWKDFVVSNIGLGATSEEFIFAVFNTQISQMDEFPTIHKLLQISVTLAPGSVDCERAFSLQNIVKTKLRNRLTVKSTSDLMRCSRDGDSIKNFNWEHHLDAFLVSKNRRIQ